MLYILTQHFQQWLDDVGLFRVVQVFTQVEFRAVAAGLVAFAIVLLAGPRTIAWLTRRKIGDNPETYVKELNERNESKRGTPTMGGILIVGAILATILLFCDFVWSRYVHLAIVVLLWLAAVGSFDDWLKLNAARRGPGTREGLYAWEKLLFQFGLGILVSWMLWRLNAASGSPAALALNLPFQRTYEPATRTAAELAVLNPAVITLGVVAFTAIGAFLIALFSNAVNLTDGLDGLSAGTVTIAALVMVVLCFTASNQAAAGFLMVPYVPGGKELMVISGAMVGACLGFLWFNAHPASVFMGDTGSLALGGLLAYLAVAIRAEALLLVLGGIFLLEAASVAMQVGYFKVSGGKRIFRCAPIHHHFQMGGLVETKVTIRMWIGAALLALVTLALLKLR
jgi:phospho-N-acetylmuramoyl-pentapeptide-transferase